jgi:hypothetical protein
MKKYKVLLALSIVLLALCIISCLFIWNLLRERELITIELPSGDRIVICYYPTPNILMALSGDGGLRYHIYSGMLSHHGSLTRDTKYDGIFELKKMEYEIEGERRVKIKDGRGHPGWIFSGAPSGHYSIVDLYKYKTTEASEDDEIE